MPQESSFRILQGILEFLSPKILIHKFLDPRSKTFQSILLVKEVWLAYHEIDLFNTLLRLQVLVQELAGISGSWHKTIVQIAGHKWSCNTWLSTLQEVRTYSQTSSQWALNVSTIRSNRLMRRDLCKGHPRSRRYSDFEKWSVIKQSELMMRNDLPTSIWSHIMCKCSLPPMLKCNAISAMISVYCVDDNLHQWENLQQFRASDKNDSLRYK